MKLHSPRVYAVLALGFTFVSGICLGQTADSAVAVRITPDTATVVSSQTLQLTAVIKNTPRAAVTWSASEGTISSNGLFRAPKVSADTTVRVTATSVADPSKSDVATVVIRPAEQAAVAADATSSSSKSGMQLSFFSSGL